MEAQETDEDECPSGGRLISSPLRLELAAVDRSGPEHSARRRRCASGSSVSPIKPTHRSQPDHAASRAEALNVRVALSDGDAEGSMQAIVAVNQPAKK